MILRVPTLLLWILSGYLMINFDSDSQEAHSIVTDDEIYFPDRTQTRATSS